LATAGKCLLFTSAFAQEEALEKYSEKGAGSTPGPDQAHAAVYHSSGTASKVDRLGSGVAHWPGRDAPILAAAIKGKVGIFVTGDCRDIGTCSRQVLEGVNISTPG
jgi:hypothetical protein